MRSEIDQILSRRLRGIQALAKSVNLSLRITTDAVKGNKDFAADISYIDERVSPSYRNVANESPFSAFYIGQSFIIMVSEFEGFLVDILKWVLQRYPMKLGSETFNLAEILELQNIEAVTSLAADRFLNAMMYRRASEYRKTLLSVLSADDDFLADRWPAYVESKARRDIGIHNDWLVNDTYKRKIKEVGLPCPAEGYLPPSNEYFWDTAALLTDLASGIAEHCDVAFRA